MNVIADAPTVERPVESRDPATGQVWRTFTAATAHEVAASAAAARQACAAWAKTPVRDRARLLRRFHDLVFDRRAEIAATIVRENGKPNVEAHFEILGALDFARFYARVAPGTLATRTHRSSNLAYWRKTIRVEREPYGVIGIITPWNHPFLLMSGVALPALVAGNAVLIKPSEFTPSSGVLFGELLHAAGVPDGIATILPGAGATGAALIDAAIDKMLFIGSEATGRKVAARAAEKMIPYELELGGSDPAIVLADADLRTAAEGIAWGRFMNAGQTCVAPKRVYVVDSAYDGFLRELESALRRSEGDVPPLIRPSQRVALEAQYRDAIDRGANVVATGPSTPSPSHFAPTVIADGTADMRMLREETFGPLLPIVRVRDEDEAIEYANATDYGLGASVWSRDIGRARAVAARLASGSVTINDSVIIAAIAEAPYGGVKRSGTGRSHGLEGLLACTRTKTIVADRWTWRQVYWHAYTAEMRRGIDAFLELSHGRGIFRRIAAGVRAVRLLYFGRRR